MPGACAEERRGGATHRLQLRELEVVHQTTDEAFVRGGLRDGEWYVFDGVQRLAPRQLVRVAAPADAAAIAFSSSSSDID